MDATAKERARDAAQAMGRAGQAIARSLKFKVGIPLTGIGEDGTGRALLDVDNLERYVASVEATRTATGELGPAQSIVVDLGRRLTVAAASGAMGADDREGIDGGSARLRDSLSHLPSLPSVSRLHQSVDVLRREIADAPWDSL
jgi:hypothetical protein